MDKSFCEYIADIHKDPFAIPERLKIKEFLALKAHVAICEDCSIKTDEIITQSKNVPPCVDESRYN
jgi:hypothetical protein